MDYSLVYTKEALKDLPKLKAANLSDKVQYLCTSHQQDPKHFYCKKLIGKLSNKYSIRINIRHRLIYEILEDEKSIKILKFWGHYDDN